MATARLAMELNTEEVTNNMVNSGGLFDDLR